MKKIIVPLFFFILACGNELNDEPELNQKIDIKENISFTPFDGTVFVSNKILTSSDNKAPER